MSGFKSPNYTQAPNDFFAMIPDMSDAELRVTAVMIRQTFGFHRDGFKMGVTKLADAAGLSRQGALDGARAAEERGTFRRTNPDEQGEAEWELVVPLNSVDTSLQPVEGEPLPNRGQVGIKESIKKESNKKEAATPPLSKPDLEEIKTKANQKVDALLKQARTAMEKDVLGQAWRGRELTPPNYLNYGDWWHKTTQQHMYGAKSKAKMNTEWLKAFKDWWENDLSIDVLAQVYEAEKSWKGVIGKPSELTTKAIALQALPPVKGNGEIPSIENDPDAYNRRVLEKIQQKYGANHEPAFSR